MEEDRQAKGREQVEARVIAQSRSRSQSRSLQSSENTFWPIEILAPKGLVVLDNRLHQSAFRMSPVS